MKLFEAIVETSRRPASSGQDRRVHAEEFADSLPAIVLTCIDPRLNALVPRALGLPEDRFIWLRNAGNIIFDTMSSMMRTLALGCAVKGGREIAIIGHTDCLVGKTSMLQLTERFRALGIDRSRLPENLNEFFGLFASERQNVIKGVDFTRRSPLIGAKVPVHGLVLDLSTGALEWVVNGYDAIGSVASTFNEFVHASASPSEEIGTLTEFSLGDMKFPEFKIGESPRPAETSESASHPAPPEPQSMVSRTPSMESTPAAESSGSAQFAEIARLFDQVRWYKIIGTDQNVYGPVPGPRVLEWIREGRIHWQTPGQPEGSTEWRPLATWVVSEAAAKAKKMAPPILTGLKARLRKDR